MRALAMAFLLCGLSSRLPAACGDRQYERLGQDPYLAPLRPHLVHAPREWYRWSVDLPAVDPVLREAAGALAHPDLMGLTAPIEGMADQPYLVIGGSVMFDAIVGSGVRTGGIGNGKLDVNALFPVKYNPMPYETFVEGRPVSAPAYGGRPAGTFLVEANGELNHDIETYVEHANRNEFLIGDNSTLNVPFKSGTLLVVPKDSKQPARIYFRTRQDYDDYHAKTLRLPQDRSDAAAKWHLSQNDVFLGRQLGYALIVYARLKAKDNRERATTRWHFSKETEGHLKAWIARMRRPPPSPELEKTITRAREQAAGQGAAPEMEAVLRELGLVN